MIYRILLLLAATLAVAAFVMEPEKYWYIGIGAVAVLIFMPSIVSYIKNWT